MNQILSPARLRAAEPMPRQSGAHKTAQPGGKPKPMMRRYEIQYLDQGNAPASRSSVAQATPLFEQAFSAFARGTLIKTDFGPCAVEDLEPGMRLITAEFGAQPLMWLGSMNLIPNIRPTRPELCQLTRVMADSFGPCRPTSDLLLGPAAEIMRKDYGGREKLVSMAGFSDADTVIRTTPPSPVQVYHLCLRRQATVFANDLRLASYHPPKALAEILGPQSLPGFLALFPHLTDLSGFGEALETPETEPELMDLF